MLNKCMSISLAVFIVESIESDEVACHVLVVSLSIFLP